MRKPETSDEALKKCIDDGLLKRQQEIDTKKIRALVGQADIDLYQAQKLVKTTSQKEPGWSTIYKLYYDVLHELIEAFLLFELVKSENHWCLFAYLIEKHEELVLDWNFLERIRTTRNGITYYGSPITYNEWKSVELQTNLYINTMRKAVEEKLKQKSF